MGDAEAEEGAPAEVAPEPAGPVAAPELLEAAMLGKLGRLKAFLDKNPDQLNLTSVKRGWSTLQVAVGFSKMEIVAELIERGADVATVDNMGMTVLHTAAESDIDVLNALLATEAGKGLINKQDNDGCVPLHYSAYSGKLANATAFLKAGCDTSIADATGKTPGQVAAEMKENKVLDVITNGPPPDEEPAAAA